MDAVFEPSGPKVYVDSFRLWPGLILLLLSGVLWLLPLSPAVTPLESKPKLPLTSPVEGQTTPLNESQIDQVLGKAGCNKDGYGDVGEHCEILEKTLGQMGVKFLEEESNLPWDSDPDIMPVLKAKCWLPAMFGLQHKEYASNVCGNLINRAIRGKEELNNEFGKNLAKTVNGVTNRKAYSNRKDVFERYNSLISCRINFLLFISSLVLLMPSLLWRRISASVWCGVKVDQTLDMLQQAQSFAPDARKETYQEISRETEVEAGSSGKVARSFILCKTLACCVSLSVLCATYQLLHKPISNLVSEVKELSDIAKLIPFQDHFWFKCYFVIKKLTNRHDFMVQCLTSLPALDGSSSGTSIDPYIQLDAARRVLLVYGGLFQAISVFLILHATFNFCGLLDWTWRLCIQTSCCLPCRNQSYSRPARYVKDVHFLLFNVHEHLGHVMCRKLADSFTQSSSQAAAPIYQPEPNESDKDDLL